MFMRRIGQLGFVLLIFSVSLAQDTSGDDYYQRGQEYRTRGKWVKALGTWFAGRQLLDKQHQADPRMGFAFIECATEHQAKAYYELACDMYFWGLSRDTLVPFHQELKQEIERIAPLLSQAEYELWLDLWRRNDPAIYQKIRHFWESRDPTPSTPRNERLLEHWERIAYARKHYTKTQTTVYGTDDRGLIYVKYGKPDKVFKGVLGANRSELKQWTDVILDNSGNEGVAVNDLRFRAEDEFVLITEINRYNYNPSYELWFYYSFDTQNPVFFLFGNEGGIGRFGLRNGVEDLIPSSAFRRVSAGRARGLVPGAVLQSVYYGQLMHLSPYFEDRYNQLQYVWDTLDRQGGPPLAQVSNTFRSHRQQFVTMDRHNPIYQQAPLERSTFESNISPVELVFVPFRFLERDSLPRIALVALSFPKIGGQFANLRADNLELKYSVMHTLVIRDRRDQEVQRISEPLPEGYDNVSTFVLPHDTTHHEYLLYSEVFNQGRPKVKIGSDGRRSVTAEVIGLGKTWAEAPPPLSPDRSRLELSDLLIGVATPEEAGMTRLPFPVVPTQRIWQSDLVKVYLEIYHLGLDEDGLGHFTIDFEVAKLKGDERSKDQSIALTFELDAAASTTKESFQVDITKLTPAKYEMLVTVTDTVSGQRKQRTARFEVVE